MVISPKFPFGSLSLGKSPESKSQRLRSCGRSKASPLWAVAEFPRGAWERGIELRRQRSSDPLLPGPETLRALHDCGPREWERPESEVNH